MLLLNVEEDPTVLDDICETDEVFEVFLVPCPILVPLKPAASTVSSAGITGGADSSGVGMVAFFNLLTGTMLKPSMSTGSSASLIISTSVASLCTVGRLTTGSRSGAADG